MLRGISSPSATKGEVDCVAELLKKMRKIAGAEGHSTMKALSDVRAFAAFVPFVSDVAVPHKRMTFAELRLPNCGEMTRASQLSRYLCNVSSNMLGAAHRGRP
jgi:hypothetical protein